MDWLFRHSVNVDCRLKKITLQTSDGKQIEMLGERLYGSVSLISAMKASNLI